MTATEKALADRLRTPLTGPMDYAAPLQDLTDFFAAGWKRHEHPLEWAEKCGGLTDKAIFGFEFVLKWHEVEEDTMFSTLARGGKKASPKDNEAETKVPACLIDAPKGTFLDRKTYSRRIICHLRGKDELIVAKQFAAANNLQALILPKELSFYWPGKTRMVIFARANDPVI